MCQSVLFTCGKHFLASPSSGQNNNETIGGGGHLTICQQQQLIAESSSGAMVGGFIPQCLSDGNYKTVQCHALTGFCWCVNVEGIRIQGTEERYKEPNCSGKRTVLLTKKTNQ